MQEIPEPQFRRAELLQVLAEEGGGSAHLLDDWRKWGGLASAAMEARGPSGGIGRYWSGKQVEVFRELLRSRVGHSRAQLAAGVVFVWLTVGEQYVPLEQARRALATWAHSYLRAKPAALRKLVARRWKRLPAAARPTPEQWRQLAALGTRHGPTVAVLLGGLYGRLGERVSAPERARVADEQQRVSELQQRGLELAIALPTSRDPTDALYHRARARWRRAFLGGEEPRWGELVCERDPCPALSLCLAVEELLLPSGSAPGWRSERRATWVDLYLV